MRQVVSCMSRRSAVLFIVLNLLTAAWSSIAMAREWKVLTHSAETQTIYTQDSGLRGIEGAGRRAFYVELVRRLLEELNQPANISNVPLKRGLLMLQDGQAEALFNLVRTPERETQFKWVGPIDGGINRFHQSSRRPTGIASLADARRVGGICVLNGGVHDSTLVDLGFTNLVRANSYTICFAMLIYGRVDLTPATRIRGRELLEEGFTQTEIETIVPTNVVLLESRGFIALSSSIPDKTVEQWQAALDQLTANGEYDLLRERFGDDEE